MNVGAAWAALCGVLLLAGLAGCEPLAVSARAGYAQSRVGGRLSLASGQSVNQAAIEQDIQSAFGLGDSSGSPFLRAQFDFGVPVVTASALWLRDSGEGQLENSFGGLPAQTMVTSRLDLTIAKLSAAFDVDLGILKLAPGVLFDVFAIDFSARETILGGREEIDDTVFVPIPFVRAQGDLGPIRAIGEVGYLEVASFGDNGGRFLDLEALVEWSPVSSASVFCGYRFIGLDGNGDTGSETFAADFDVRGWVIGGGFRF